MNSELEVKEDRRMQSALSSSETGVCKTLMDSKRRNCRRDQLPFAKSTARSGNSNPALLTKYVVDSLIYLFK